MEVLSSRVLMRPVDLPGTQAFYRDILGLAVAREFGPEESPGLVFHMGQGLLEVSGTRPVNQPSSLVLWLQVRDLAGEVERLRAAAVPITREPQQESWGLFEAWIEDPDGTKIVLVQIPENHPLRRDVRKLEA